MKLSISVRSEAAPEPSATGRGWAEPSRNTFELETTEQDNLTAEQIERLVRLWLMAATDSAAVTQDVIDEITAKLKQNSNGLQAAIDAVVSQ